MKNFIQRIALSIAIVSLVGCAAKVTQTSVPTSSSAPATATAPQEQARGLVAILNAEHAVRNSSDWKSFERDWRASLSNAAKNSKVPFFFIQDEKAIPANAAVLVRLSVNNFRYVSTGKRVMMGVLTGNASMDVDAQYIDLASSQAYGTQKFNTSSSAWEGIFSSVTPKQVQAVSEIIVKEAIANKPAQ